MNSLSEGFYKINELVFLYSENQSLKQENNSLKKWKDLGLKLLVENEELKGLLNTAKKDNQKFTTARVISNSGGSYVKTITINAGSNDGVKVGNPVVNNWGMVGRVVDLGKNASESVINSRHKFSNSCLF